MTLDQPIEQVVRDIAGLDRADCITRLRAVREPRLDFTDDYLQSRSVDQLRHLLLAACIQARRRQA